MKEREKPHFYRQARYLERVTRAEKIASRHSEDRTLKQDHDEQNPLTVREEPLT